MSRLRILVTGGTGFLGDQVVPLLREFADLTLISRSTPGALRGDLTSWNARLEPDELAGNFDVLLHMAGLYDLRAGQVESMKHNAGGTHTAMALAQQIGIKHVIHISTLAVAMNSAVQPVDPDKLTTQKRFPDNYSLSKAHAEHVVRFWPHEFETKLILRPGILVGDTKGSPIVRIDGPYHAPWGLAKIRDILAPMPGPVPLPGKDSLSIPIVPVDAAARAIRDFVRLVESGDVRGTRGFHLVPQHGLPIRDFFRSVLDNVGLKEKDILLLEHVPRQLSKILAEYSVGIPREELEYLLNLPQLDESETRKYLGDNWCPPFEDFKDAFWAGYEKFISNR